MVVPWHLSNVLAGDPIVYAPYVESARYAADMRNRYWSVLRRENDEKMAQRAISSGKKPKTFADDYYDIKSPVDLSPYPAPKDKDGRYRRTRRWQQFRPSSTCRWIDG